MNKPDKKRGYLLPRGCKNLIDVLKPKVTDEEVPSVRVFDLPPIVGQIKVPSVLTIGKLAAMLNQKPSRIVKDVWRLFGHPVTERHLLQFFEIEQVVRLYGFTTKQTS